MSKFEINNPDWQNLSFRERTQYISDVLCQIVSELLLIKREDVQVDTAFENLCYLWKNPEIFCKAFNSNIDKYLYFKLHDMDLENNFTIALLAKHISAELKMSPKPLCGFTDPYQGGYWAWGEPGVPPVSSALAGKMLFIFSTGRSGSTLLRTMLMGHSEIYAPPELYLLPFDSMQQRLQKIRALKQKWMQKGLVQTFAMQRELSENQAILYMHKQEQKDVSVSEIYKRLLEYSNDRWLVDKTPYYSNHVGWLQRAECFFVEPHYLFLSRHPHAVIESSMQRRFYYYSDNINGIMDSNPWLAMEKVWATQNQNILDFLSTIPKNRQHHLHYEDLVQNPEQEQRKICQFLKLDYNSSLINLYEGDCMLQDFGDPHLWKKYTCVDATLADKWKKLPALHALSPYTLNVAKQLGYYEFSSDIVKSYKQRNSSE